MLTLSKLEEVVAEQFDVFKNRDIGVIRDIDFEKYLKTKQITVISGARRSGKSVLLRQFAEKFSQFYFINFDDERLVDFELENFNDLMLAFKKTYQSKVIFLDEIQNISGWERFVRRLYEEEYKIFVTGSNAKLLSAELATHLTGRYFKVELYPFSFKELLIFKDVDWTKKDANTKVNALNHFDEYLLKGGFPEYVRYQDSEFVKRTYEDIIYRDIITRFNIKEVKSFRELAGFLFANFTQEMSYNALKKALGFKSVMSVKNYVNFLENSYLVFELYKYDYSFKKQFVSDKKIYVIDNGMRNEVAFSFSEDKGKLLENAVFLELKRRAKEIYYFKAKKECDFIVKTKNKITSAIQVTSDLNQNNKDRELEGLLEAMKEFKLKKGLILTKDQEQVMKKDGFVIEIAPLWKWLLRV